MPDIIEWKTMAWNASPAEPCKRKHKYLYTLFIVNDYGEVREGTFEYFWEAQEHAEYMCYRKYFILGEDEFEHVDSCDLDHCSCNPFARRHNPFDMMPLFT